MMITIARKTGNQVVDPPSQSYRSGALNIDLCRVGVECVKTSKGAGFGGTSLFGGGTKPREESDLRTGRWPANVLHDGSDAVLAGFLQTQSGSLPAQQYLSANRNNGSMFAGAGVFFHKGYAPDSGSAARFFKQVGEPQC